jgi:ABC-type multidrug transport system ATPase subunit
MTPLLVTENVAKRYGTRLVLRDVTFVASRGEVVGLIGPNGAGKTTLLRIVLGLQHADAGTVLLDGTNVESAITRIRVAYFAGEPTIPAVVRSRAWRALFHETEDHAENRPVRELSRGTRQLLGLRTVFALPALRFIVLDEPWEGLDPDASRWLSESIRSRRASGATILVSSHRLHDLAGVCDRFVFLDNGSVATLSAREVKQDGRLTGESLLDVFDELRGGPR